MLFTGAILLTIVVWTLFTFLKWKMANGIFFTWAILGVRKGVQLPKMKIQFKLRL